MTDLKREHEGKFKAIDLVHSSMFMKWKASALGVKKLTLYPLSMAVNTQQ